MFSKGIISPLWYISKFAGKGSGVAERIPGGGRKDIWALFLALPLISLVMLITVPFRECFNCEMQDLVL